MFHNSCLSLRIHWGRDALQMRYCFLWVPRIKAGSQWIPPGVYPNSLGMAVGLMNWWHVIMTFESPVSLSRWSLTEAAGNATKATSFFLGSLGILSQCLACHWGSCHLTQGKIPSSNCAFCLLGEKFCFKLEKRKHCKHCICHWSCAMHCFLRLIVPNCNNKDLIKSFWKKWRNFLFQKCTKYHHKFNVLLSIY